MIQEQLIVQMTQSVITGNFCEGEEYKHLYNIQRSLYINISTQTAQYQLCPLQQAHVIQDYFGVKYLGMPFSSEYLQGQPVRLFLLRLHVMAR